MEVVKHYTDVEMETLAGTFLYDNNWTFIDSNQQYIRINTPTKLLCVIDRNSISEELCQLAEQNYKNVGKMISTNRGHAAGAVHRDHTHKTYELGIAANTGVIGYLDSANSKRSCRLSQFSRQHFQEYQAGLPFIHRMNELFKKHVPEKYESQKTAIENAKDDNGESFCIENTAFSTVTVNYNFRTALHKDSGDYRQGFGTIAVVSKNISGGHLCFPQYKLMIEIGRGDFIAMDVHEWHCNTEILPTTKDGYRLSFVAYFKERLLQCRDINRRLDLHLQESDRPATANELIAYIFENNLPEKLTIKDKNEKPWWSMENENYRIEYRWKRYYMIDKLKNPKNKIHGLWPAWEYVYQQRKNKEI